MKVILINPPTPQNEVWVREGRCQQFDIWGAPFPPLSLAYIAGQIKEIAEPLIIDSPAENLDLNKTLLKLKEFGPDLIMISCATPTIDSDLGWFLEAVKKELPQVKSAAIGVHVSALPQETLRDFPLVDFVIRGEPEITARELIEALISKKPFSSVLGLGWKDGENIIINKERDFIHDLDSLALPYWPGVYFSNYRMPIIGKPFTLITFARGCPFLCKFCNASAYYGKAIRKRNPVRIVEEIEKYVSQGINDFLFWTEFLTQDRGYLEKFLDLLFAAKLHKKIRWISNSRVDFVDFELFRKMKEAGCWQLVFGLEFGNNKILELAKKGTTLAQGEKAVNEAAEAGLVVDGHFILGYPGETEKTLEDTINFAFSLPLAFAHFYAATPFPGSQLYKEALENSWLVNKDWAKISQDRASLRTPWLDEKTVEKYIAKAYRKFYFRPKIFWRILKIAKTPYQFLNILGLGTKFVLDLLRK